VKTQKGEFLGYEHLLYSSPNTSLANGSLANSSLSSKYFLMKFANNNHLAKMTSLNTSRLLVIVTFIDESLITL
jgi:hypothetical protein